MRWKPPRAQWVASTADDHRFARELGAAQHFDGRDELVEVDVQHPRVPPLVHATSLTPVSRCAKRRSGVVEYRLRCSDHDASREVLSQSLEQAPAAFLPVRPVGPESVEEDAVLDVREPGALVDRVELKRRH